MATSTARHPLAGLVLAALLWGSSFTLLKYTLTVFDPLLVIFARLAIATLVLLPFIRHCGPLRVRRQDWKWLALMVLCEPVLYFWLETAALRLTSSAAAATIIALLPLAVALAARCILQERVSGRLWRGLLIALAGTLLLTGYGQPSALAPVPGLGNSLEALALLAAVGYTLTAKELSGRYPAVFLTVVQNAAGALCYAPLLWLPVAQPLEPFSWTALLALVYLGAAVSGAAYFLYNAALSRLPASRVALYTSLIPVVAAGFGWLILGETLSRLQSLAIVLVLGGLWHSLPSEPRRAAEQPF